MLGELAVAYLFLGGVGAGCVCAACVLDLGWVRERFDAAHHAQGLSGRGVPRMLGISFSAGFVALCVGAACLVADLGHPERMGALLLSPSPSWMSLGAASLGALIVLAGALSLVRVAYFPCVRRPLVAACEVLALALGTVVVFYTGFLLQTLSGAALWRSAWLPFLFALSSVSGGMALVVLSGLGAGVSRSNRAMLRGLALADVAAILLEAAAAAGFLATALGDANPGMAAGAASLAEGDSAALWWGGFAACGVALPLVAELAFLAGSARADAGALVAASAAMVLAGALFLRISVVDAGEWRPLELQNPPYAASVMQEVSGNGSDAS